MKVEDFINALNTDFYTGVPDSQLKAVCNYLIKTYGVDGKHHIIAANEGNAVGIAAGYFLATGKTPVVYMQNSGEGNAINPIASLLNEKVYGIPCVFIIGWRGEPGVHDEPQHVFQGEITLQLLKDLDIEFMVLSSDTSIEDIKDKIVYFNSLLSRGKQCAFVVRKNALTYDEKVEYRNNNVMLREDIIKHVVNVSKDDLIVSTTGKASRELFEIREQNNQPHKYDFLTVGSMGHSSSIALGIALQRPDKKVWVIDGDGAALMHMGAMAVIANQKPNNLIHIIINNSSHESVGGQPTVMGNIDMPAFAKSLGYSYSTSVDNYDDLDSVLNEAKHNNQLSFIEIKSAIGARDDLGRPTNSAKENKNCFVENLIGKHQN